MMHFQMFQIFPLFSKNIKILWEISYILSFPEKISDFHSPKFLMTFFSSTTNFKFPPYFASFTTFSPLISKNSYFHPTFTHFPPVFGKFTSFLHTFCVHFPPLAMMHLCITQCTYWTPLCVEWTSPSY